MTDLGDRFAEDEGGRRSEARPDPLARLQAVTAPAAAPEESPLRRLVAVLRGRTDLLAVAGAALTVLLVIWPLLWPAALTLPPVADTGDEMARLTVRPLLNGGTATTPDWASLFDAYHFETRLRDISIRCNYGLPVDARVDRYLHAPLGTGITIRVFLADPGTCPRL